ncbi:hypothetical protein B0H14DRAFT_976360 [Mycena olivaceomarginata]|nr:hypothetical protein B0H14DRAFT_976360 [Mycena olivaceomarginata]
MTVYGRIYIVNRAMKMRMVQNARLSELVSEGLRDLIIIFAIMTMEAIFVQMPSVRTHARNYISPFVDSLTALLATRFIMGLAREIQGDEAGSATSSPRPSFESFRVSIASTNPAAMCCPASGASPQPALRSLQEESVQSSSAHDHSALFPPWPPEAIVLDDIHRRPSRENEMEWPSVEGGQCLALDMHDSTWPPETFHFATSDSQISLVSAQPPLDEESVISEPFKSP